MVSLKCENCGAELEVDPDQPEVYCSYCGSQLLLDDKRIHITRRIVDEARLKEAEIRLKELEYRHELELKEHASRQEEKRAYMISAGLFALALVVSLAIEEIRPFSVFLLIFGCIAFTNMRRSDTKNVMKGVRYGVSDKSRIVALLLCFFLGIWGVHYFYVGKKGMGVVYIFTFGLFGIGILVDMIRIACGTFRDSYGLLLKQW